MRRLKFTSSASESLLLSETVGLFLESGSYEHHLRKLRRFYYAQVTAVRGLIARHFPAGTSATQPEGGFLLWVETVWKHISQPWLQRMECHYLVPVRPGEISGEEPILENQNVRW